MTAIFYDRKEGCNKRFDHVVEMKFGIEQINGAYEQVSQVFFKRSAETLMMARYHLLAVQK